jgi:hypothetical protein
MTLPNFLIIGAAKAGTTSLYHYLRQHPDVYLSPVKEPRYYWLEGLTEGNVQVRTREAYEKLFAGRRNERAIGEASPQYLNSPTAPDRIAADLPDVKLIVSLRNPAERAYSSYMGRIRGATETRPIERALCRGSHHVEASFYHPQLSRFFSRFPRNRIKVILFDDLLVDARAVVRDLFEWLEVADFDVDVSTLHNQGGVPRSVPINTAFLKTMRFLRGLVPTLYEFNVTERLQRPFLRKAGPMPMELRRQLLELYRDDVLRTGELIGKDLVHWLT